MDLCEPDIDAIKNNLQARYRQKVKDDLSDNGASTLDFVIIDVLLELTAEMLGEYDRALRKSNRDGKTASRAH